MGGRAGPKTVARGRPSRDRRTDRRTIASSRAAHGPPPSWRLRPTGLRPAPIVHGTPRRGGAPSAQTAATERDAAGGHCSTEPTPQRCRTIACRRKDHDPPALAAPARRPACAPLHRESGTRRAHARAKHRRCCCPWRRAAWRPPVLPSSPEREEHARAVAVSPRTAADENAEQCDCLSGSSGCGGESQFEVSEWLVARVGICCTAAAEQH